MVNKSMVLVLVWIAIDTRARVELRSAMGAIKVSEMHKNKK